LNDVVRLIVTVIAMGAAGAALMDVWSLALRRLWKVPTLDYAMLGRWIGHLVQGRFFHERIAASAPIPGERLLGWLAHYGIGIAFAVPVVIIGGSSWVAAPTVAPAMLVAMGTILAPWFVMQPGMGLGLAASRSARPWATRARNLVTHAVYGLGMYTAALALTGL
jgi:Protein of unknown function (DUF2938)